MSQPTPRARRNTMPGSGAGPNRHRHRRSTSQQWSNSLSSSPLTEDREVLLPFRFGAEFELQLRARVVSNIALPAPDASVSSQRRFNINLLGDIARLLSQEGMAARAFDASNDEEPDFTKWTVMMDGSLSKGHMRGILRSNDVIDPVEIVTPVLTGDESWSGTLDKFWTVLLVNFEVRFDSTAGTHVHISWSHGAHSLEELRRLAKAVVF
ncbi:putative amidoligase enzyme-domain-containing protein [Xylaria venustula]|nr:putative amidoligase enzyme-domain-containing protein [Xylaria venustula]